MVWRKFRCLFIEILHRILRYIICQVCHFQLEKKNTLALWTDDTSPQELYNYIDTVLIHHKWNCWSACTPHRQIKWFHRCCILNFVRIRNLDVFRSYTSRQCRSIVSYMTCSWFTLGGLLSADPEHCRTIRHICNEIAIWNIISFNSSFLHREMLVQISNLYIYMVHKDKKYFWLSLQSSLIAETYTTLAYASVQPIVGTYTTLANISVDPNSRDSHDTGLHFSWA